VPRSVVLRGMRNRAGFAGKEIMAGSVCLCGRGRLSLAWKEVMAHAVAL
jgi:hypothetical protein